MDIPHFLGNKFPDHLSQLAVCFGEKRDILVSIDHQDLGRGDDHGGVLVDQPVLVEAVHPLEELQLNLLLLRPLPAPDSGESHLWRGLEVDDEVHPHVVVVGVCQQVVPGVQYGHLPPSDGWPDVLNEAGPGTVDTPLHHLHSSVVRAAQSSAKVDLSHGERHQGLEGHSPPLWVGVGQAQEVGAVEVLPDVERLSVDTDVRVLSRGGQAVII